MVIASTMAMTILHTAAWRRSHPSARTATRADIPSGQSEGLLAAFSINASLSLPGPCRSTVWAS